ALIAPMRALGAMEALGEKDDYLRHNLFELKRFVDDLDHREAVTQKRDYDGLEAALAGLSRHRSWTYKHFGPTYGPNKRAEALAQRDALKSDLDLTLKRAEADLAACLHEDLWPLVGQYEREKARAGKLDFFDLLLRLKELLQRDAAVRAQLQRRFTHLF